MTRLNYSVPIIFCIFLFSVTGGCTIHRLEIQQGTVIDPEQVERIKTGMNKEQIRFLLGSPSLKDPFHPDRWDYVYSLKKPGKPTMVKHMTLWFSKDSLKRIEGRESFESPQTTNKGE